MIDREALINAAEQAYAETPAIRDMGRTARRVAYTTLINALTSTGEGTVPVGWQLVPKEPTKVMIEAVSELGSLASDGYGDVGVLHDDAEERIYNAMLAAAPHPPSQDGAREGVVVDRLYDDNAPTADGEVRMTAAESVLAWLLVEKIGVPDDVSYTPKAAQETIAKKLDRAKELYEIDDMLREGQGDDDGAQILPDFKAGMSVSAKVEACLFLLEKRRDVIEAFTNKAPDEAEREACASICDALAESWEHPTDKDCSTKEGALWYGRRQGAIAAAQALRSRRDVGGV